MITGFLCFFWFAIFTAQVQQYESRQSSKPSYYTVLGVDKDADENSIKKAYRKLAMKVSLYCSLLVDSDITFPLHTTILIAPPRQKSR